MMCEQLWFLAVLQLLKLSSDPLRNLLDAECIFSDDLGIFYPSDLPNSAQKFCGGGKDFTDIFPGWFSAAL